VSSPREFQAKVLRPLESIVPVDNRKDQDIVGPELSGHMPASGKQRRTLFEHAIAADPVMLFEPAVGRVRDCCFHWARKHYIIRSVLILRHFFDHLTFGDLYKRPGPKLLAERYLIQLDGPFRIEAKNAHVSE